MVFDPSCSETVPTQDYPLSHRDCQGIILISVSQDVDIVIVGQDLVLVIDDTHDGDLFVRGESRQYDDRHNQPGGGYDRLFPGLLIIAVPARGYSSRTL